MSLALLTLRMGRAKSGLILIPLLSFSFSLTCKDPFQTSVEACTRGVKSRLHTAVENNDLDRTRELLEAGADPLCPDERGLSPYSLAIENENTDLLRLFGFRQFPNEQHPFTAACTYNKPRSILFMMNEAEFFRVGEEEKARCLLTLLDTAFPEPQISEISAQIIAQLPRAALERTSVDGNTALMFAAMSEQTEILKLLIDKGVDVNARPENLDCTDAAARCNAGSTALHWAIMMNKLESQRILRAAGAAEPETDARSRPP